jgi:hypothetical protein
MRIEARGRGARAAHHLARDPGCNGSVEYGTNGEGV